MRNASFSDIVYELIWFVQDCLVRDPEWWGATVRDPKTGEEKPGWGHSFDTTGEWISGLLADLGILEGTDPYFLIRVPAAQCKSIDFSRFETFDCYVEAMRTLSMHPNWVGEKIIEHWMQMSCEGRIGKAFRSKK
jgi:hypothetical protein